MISSSSKRLLSGAPDKEIIAASTSVHRQVHFSKGAEDSCREIFASVVHMIKKVAVNLSKVAERWAMKKPVRRIDQQLIVVSGRSLISGADMSLGRRLYSSMYAAIPNGLVGENTRYETGSLLSRSVPRMRAEVCLHTGLCLRAKCLLFSPNSEDPRVVSSFSTPAHCCRGCPAPEAARRPQSHLVLPHP